MKQQILEAKVTALQDALLDAASALVTIGSNIRYDSYETKLWLYRYAGEAKAKAIQALEDSHV